MAGIIPVTRMNAQAQDAWNAQQAEFRKAAAYNALNKVYGPIAGDPDAALKMQDYGFNQQMQPLKMEGARNANALNRQSLDYRAQANPLALEGSRLANDKARTGASDAESEANRKAFLKGATYVMGRIAEGGDAGAAFDEVAPYLPGTPEQKKQIRDTIVANPGELDDFVSTFGDDDDLQAGLTPIYGEDANGNTVVLQTTKNGRVIQPQMPKGVTVSKEPIRMDAGDRIILLDPVTRQTIGVVMKGGAPSADQTAVQGGGGVGAAPSPAAPQAAPGAPGAPAQQAAAPAQVGTVPGQQPARLVPTPGSKLDMERRAAAEDAIDQQQAQETMAGAVAAPVLRTFTRAMTDYLPNFAPGDSVVGATERYAKSWIPGTAENQFVTEIITPMANISLERLRQMRAQSSSGASGLGQVTEAEHKMLQNSLGAVDVTLPPEKLRENLHQLHNTFLDIIFGSPKQRARLVEKGSMTAEQSAEIDAQYENTNYDKFGNRKANDMEGVSDKELIRQVLGEQ